MTGKIEIVVLRETINHYNPRMGIFAALLSAVFSTSKDIVSKKLAVRIDGTASTFASFAFALPFYLILLIVLGVLGYDIWYFSAAFWWLVFWRALTDVFAEAMKMYAFAHGDVSVVTLFFSISPLFVLALSPWLPSEERISGPGAAAVVLVVLGSLALVYRPSHPAWGPQKKAILLAVGASGFFALNSMLDRQAVLQKKDDPAIAVVAAFSMTLLSSVLLLPFMFHRPTRWVGMVVYRRGLLARGILEVAFMTVKLLAMLTLEAAYVVGLQRLSLVLSIIAGRVVFKEGDFGRRLLAALLILAGVVWIVFEKEGLVDWQTVLDGFRRLLRLEHGDT